MQRRANPRVHRARRNISGPSTQPPSTRAHRMLQLSKRADNTRPRSTHHRHSDRVWVRHRARPGWVALVSRRRKRRFALARPSCCKSRPRRMHRWRTRLPNARPDTSIRSRPARGRQYRVQFRANRRAFRNRNRTHMRSPLQRLSRARPRDCGPIRPARGPRAPYPVAARRSPNL